MIENKLITAGITLIAGVDEAGRGACAGPLVVAAVILNDPQSKELIDVRDSKELSPSQRETLFDLIIRNSKHHAIIEISSHEIDRIGLHRANLEGMRRAISALGEEPQYVLTDGYEIEGLSSPSLAVWKGDQVAISISAASILAKVHRDRLMQALDKDFPGYGLALHKGYVTRAHQEALKMMGVSAIHRRSYANIAALLNS
ncbi:MAG: ribonuclease HII [Actinobacteria bacterium]|jgi:ribonuclease HII|nr:ribonuclease HII [Actinomycetota bacterium]NCU89725.1 ribonuclease HII [Actinomycetota bacterium]